MCAQVSRNYLAALQHLAPDLDQMGVEVIAVSGDPRERAEAFVRFLRTVPIGITLSMGSQRMRCCMLTRGFPQTGCSSMHCLQHEPLSSTNDL